VFSRFNPRSRIAVLAAHEADSTAGQPHIAPGHLALGLLADPDSVAAHLLTGQGITADALRTAVAEGEQPPADTLPDLIPYDAAARKALELTFRVALRLGHNFIGTEHLLLALLEHENLSGGGPLTTLGADPEAAETEIVRTISALLNNPTDEPG
ncbi:Clp protease N-terminal domain-containing protein, partial [Streptomyces albidoflavus]